MRWEGKLYFSEFGGRQFITMEYKNYISSKATYSSLALVHFSFFPFFYSLLLFPPLPPNLFYPMKKGGKGERKKITEIHSRFLANSIPLDFAHYFHPSTITTETQFFVSLFFINKCVREICFQTKQPNLGTCVPFDFCILQKINWLK